MFNLITHSTGTIYFLFLIKSHNVLKICIAPYIIAVIIFINATGYPQCISLLLLV